MPSIRSNLWGSRIHATLLLAGLMFFSGCTPATGSAPENQTVNAGSPEIWGTTPPEKELPEAVPAAHAPSIPQAGNGSSSAGQNRAAPAAAPSSAAMPGASQQGTLLPCWQDLRARLAQDGLSGKRVDALLATLGPLTQSPMGHKMKEMYNNKFFPKPPTAKSDSPYYKGVVLPANAAKCRAFIGKNRNAFAAAEKRFGVPPAVGAALLFVETRLGTQLGDVRKNAFQTLASMAESRRIEDIPNWYGKLPGWEEHRDWFA